MPTSSRLIMPQFRRAPGNPKKAIQTFRRHGRIMGKIQRSLLPSPLPAIPTLELAATNRPARIVGGDYFDFAEAPDGRWFTFLADVSGHGPSAAILVAAIHGIIHTKLKDASSPARFLRDLNGYLSASYTRKDLGFATAFLALYDPRERSLTYASAGHVPARLVSSARHRVELLKKGAGYPLGILDSNDLEDTVQRLDSGDRLVLCTDGITEALSPDGTLFGSQRLDQALAHAPWEPQALITALLSLVDAFSGGSPPRDDQTLVVATVL
jgi:sigma-B regulation protein RsbU (phosphoserine phosphatase)